MIFGNSNMLQPSHNTVPGNHKISNLMKNIKIYFLQNHPHPTIHHFHQKFQSFGPRDRYIFSPSNNMCLFISLFHPPNIPTSIILIINLFLILILIPTINHHHPSIHIQYPSTIQYPIHNPPFNPRDPPLQIKI